MKITAKNNHRLYPPFILFSWIWGWVIFADALYSVPLANLSASAQTILLIVLNIFFKLNATNVEFLAVLTLGCIIIVNPKHKMLFYAASMLFLVKQILIMPALSNHRIIVTFFSLSLVLTYFYLAIKDHTLYVSSKRFYETTAPIGRCLLIIMYVFGIFHKLNSSFLDPSVSCAVALWQNSPLPQSLLMAHWAHYCAIYGTFVIEGLCIVLLLGNSRMRYYGVLLGVSFHLFLGVNSFQFYGTFSLLSMALHFLFLPDATLKRFTLRKWSFKPIWLYRTLTVLLVVFLFALLIFLGCLSTSGNVHFVNLLFMVYGIFLLCFVAHYGYELQSEKKPIVSPLLLLNTVSVLFFLNCISPYVGLKTGQSIAMFSNLTIEEGKSNHLIIRKPLYLFNYLNEYVTIIDSNDPFLKDMATYHLLLQKVFFDNYVTSIPSKSVTFQFQGKTHTYQTINEYLKVAQKHSWFENKFIVSYEYDKRIPRTCALIDQVIMQPYKPIIEVNHGYKK